MMKNSRFSIRNARLALGVMLVLGTFAGGCGGGSCGNLPDGSVDASSAVQCASPSDCSGGTVCCVDYDANSARSSSTCKPAGDCAISHGVDTGQSIACNSTADCGSSPDGGTYSCVTDSFIGFAGKLCLAN
jgi:hypothetical protein